MSKLIVEVCVIEEIKSHPKGDRLMIARVKGWQTCIKKDPLTGQPEFQVGQKCIYIPPDAILPPSLANSPADDPPGRLGVMNYLATLPSRDNVQPAGGRVRAAVLRGTPSYGLVFKIDPAYGDDPNWPVGTDLIDHFGITKWDPSEFNPNAMENHPYFHRFVEIEHIGNFPYAFMIGELVILLEKVHGMNFRCGMVADDDGQGNVTWIEVVGSHDVRLREFEVAGGRSIFWQAYTDNLRDLILYLRDEYHWHEPKTSVQTFQELIGSGIQDMTYGYANGKRGILAYDISINRQYLDYDESHRLFTQFNIPVVPLLYRGPFSPEVIEQYTSGPTMVCEQSGAGKFKGREGLIVRPVAERESDELCGRLILKSVAADYLARPGGTDRK